MATLPPDLLARPGREATRLIARHYDIAAQADRAAALERSRGRLRTRVRSAVLDAS